MYSGVLMRWLVVLLLVTLPAAAQLPTPTVDFKPGTPTPTDLTFVEVTILHDCALAGPTAIREQVIESRLTLTDCTRGPATARTYSAAVGSLMPGTYSYRLYVDGAPVATRRLVVEDRLHVPPLAPITLGALALVVIGFALVRMK